MCLSVIYHLQISKIGPAQQTTAQKLTLWLFDELCVNQIYLTTFQVLVAILDGSTYTKSPQLINLSEHINTKLIISWQCAKC